MKAFLLLLLCWACQASSIATPTIVFPSRFNIATLGTFGNASSPCAPLVREQGRCGSCYSFAAATAIGSSLCFASNDPAFLEISPQYLLNLRFNNASGEVNPCAGGSAHKTMLLLAASALMSKPAGTCLNASCSVGCLPYVESDCIEPLKSLNLSYALDYMNSDCDGSCWCPSFSQVSCEEGYIPLTLPPFSAVWLDSILLINTTAAITAVQNWLMTHGPVTANIDSCPALDDYYHDELDAWRAGRLNTNTNYAEKTTHNNNSTNNNDGDDGSNSDVPPPFRGRCDNPTPNHVVTITGWTTVSGESWWIVQNSWGDSGDEGFFYVPFALVGPGQFTMAYPGGIIPSTNHQQGGVFNNSDHAIDAEVAAAGDQPIILGGAPRLMNLATEKENVLTVLQAYISAVTVKRSFQHTLQTLHNITEQVVNGRLYHIHATMSDDSGAQLHHSAVLLMDRESHSNGNYSLLRFLLTPDG